MKRKRRLLFNSYELEIKVSLILLIAFLLSLNFVSSYSLGKARQSRQVGYLTKLDLAVKFIRDHIERNNYKLPEPSYLNDICFFAGSDKIEITDSLGNKMIGVGTTTDSGTKWFSQKTYLKEENIRNKQGQWAYRIIVLGANREEANLRRMALLDTIFRTLGLIAGLIVAFLFFRSVMDPYRKIKKEASRLNVSLDNPDDSDSVEYAVRLFQEIIHQLKEKEAILQTMYDSSEKRADSLARYNEYILGSISSGAIICDNEGIITRVNRSATVITGFNENESHGKHFVEVFGKKHQISKILNDALKGRTYSRQEFEITRTDGEKLWIGLSSSSISDDQDQKIGAAVLLTDLTNIKKLQEMADYREKMAALGEMTAGLAHELRNSVAAIVGFGKLLKKMVLPDEKAVAIVDTVIGESMATEEMLGRFLNFAKPFHLVQSEVDIIGVIQDAINQTADTRQGKDIEIIFEPPQDLPCLLGDQLLLRNALTNLIINAYQAIEDKGTLTISAAHRPKENRLEITITDTGCGINSDNLPKIFNPFFTTRDKGTGLGLALVKKIITSHNGMIEVTSKPAEGTVFTIILPINVPKQSGDSVIAPEISQKKAPTEVHQ